ncbi:MAG: bifunctional 4-hydroxy-2-oxoglutarate aldolase/2-dehydro-3-deoxy-phosphogluconate aldolase [Candidatus Omnitrophota bacterium]
MDSLLKSFEDFKLAAVIRSSSPEDAENMIKAAMDGGFRLFEISMLSNQPFRLLEAQAKKEGCVFGASGVTNGEVAQRAINAGARFISSSFTDRDVITVAKHNDTFVIQGALTPTEALNAYQLGADMIRVYPVNLIGGPGYLKLLRSTLPSLKFMAAGGVTLDNAFVYLKDCVAVSVGKALFDRTLLRSDNWAEITDRARQLTQKLDALRVPK